MAMLKSYHTELITGSSQRKETSSLNMINIVNNITNNILRDAPQLVAEAENGNIQRKVLEKAIIQDIDKNKYHFGHHREEVIKKVFDYMFGYGILQELIEDQDVSDIDFTKANEGTITRNGIRTPLELDFGNERLLETYCKLTIVRNGGKLDENHSHWRVSDEKYRLRINASIAPRNSTGPALSIRKHRLQSYTFDDLIRLEMMNADIAEFVDQVAKSNIGFIISGMSGAGKTTLYRTKINSMPELDRILVIESDSELYPDKRNCIVQKVKKAHDGGIPVTLKDLFRDGVTMTLDGYMIGEIVSDESYEAVKAGNTGTRIGGSTHSISAYDTFPRLLTLIQGARVTESERTIKEMLARSFGVIIHMDKFKVSEILEVVGYDAAKDEFRYNPLFKFEQQGQDQHDRPIGKFVRCGEPTKELKHRLGRRR